MTLLSQPMTNPDVCQCLQTREQLTRDVFGSFHAFLPHLWIEVTAFDDAKRHFTCFSCGGTRTESR